MKFQKEIHVIPAEAGIQQAFENYMQDEPLDSRFRALLSGIIFIWVITPVILQITIVFDDIAGLHKPRLVDAETA